eukprot:1186605-Rhodomonas_salina.1
MSGRWPRIEIEQNLKAQGQLGKLSGSPRVLSWCPGLPFNLKQNISAHLYQSELCIKASETVLNIVTYSPSLKFDLRKKDIITIGTSQGIPPGLPRYPGTECIFNVSRIIQLGAYIKSATADTAGFKTEQQQIGQQIN